MIYFNSDTATANLLTKEQIETGQFFPKEWIYVQDIWTLFINVPMILLSFFIKNQLVLRSTGVLIQTILLITVLIIFSKKIFMNKSYLVYIAIVFSGISEMYMENIFFQAAYGYVLLFTIALYILGNESIDRKFNINKKVMIIFLIVVCISCIGGVRYLGVFVAPFLLAVVLTYIFENHTESKDTAIKSITNFLKWFLPVIISCFIGLMIFKKIISSGNYSFGVSKPLLVSYFNLEILGDSLKAFIQGLMVNFGYVGGVGLMSLAGVSNIFKLMCIIPVLFIIPIIVTKNFKQNTTNLNRIAIFYWSVFLVNFIISVFCGVGFDFAGSSRYFQITTIIAMILSSNYAYEKIVKDKFWISSICFISVLVFAIFGICSIAPTLNNYNVKMQSTNQLIETLKKRNLRFGYATYWNAYKNSVIANFDPEIVAIEAQPIQAKYFLNSKRFYKSEYYQGETFLLLTNEEFKEYNKNNKLNIQLGEPKELIKEQEYTILIYNYNISKHFINVPIKIGENKDLKVFMHGNQYVLKDEENNINIEKHGILYGPYTNLEKGKYEILVECNFDDIKNEQLLRITSDSSAKQIGDYKIKNGKNKITFQLDGYTQNVEFVISNEDFNSVKINEINLIKIE